MTISDRSGQSGRRIISERVTQLRTEVDQLITAVGALQHSVDEIRDYMQKAGRADWNILGLWAGLLVTVFLGVGTLYTRPMIEDISQNRQNLLDQMKQDREALISQGATHTLLSRHDRQLDDLDAVLQRQQEIRHLIAVEAGKIAHVEEKVNSLNDRVTRHQADHHPHSVLRELERLSAEIKAIQANRFTANDYLELQGRE